MVDGWPPITEPLLGERQAMSHEAFLVYLHEVLETIGTREMPDGHYETAVGYPWERPPGSCLVTEHGVEPVGEEPTPRQEELIALCAGDGERVPLLAYGSNASPGRLSLKLAHLDEPDREALVLAGVLEDFDVGAAAQPPMFSSMPATLIPSPGTTVRVAVLFLTPAQFTALWWTEVSYTVGALEGVKMSLPLLDRPLDRVIAFVSRYGSFSPDGEPVAMEAVPATGRRHRALTQLELLETGARLALGDGATARDLVRQAYESPAAFMAAHYDAFRAAALPFRSSHWNEMPAGAG